jgi:hypothetical protein
MNSLTEMLTLGCIVLLMAVALIVGSLNITLPCRVYLAIPMTGYDKQEMIQISKQAIFLAKQYGLDAWSPVVYEGVCGRGKLEADTTLTEKWAMDKVALRYKCFVFLNLQADNKSFGCERELGLMRYSYWRPVVSISQRHCWRLTHSVPNNTGQMGNLAETSHVANQDGCEVTT